jgi:hypothetical protein
MQSKEFYIKVFHFFLLFSLCPCGVQELRAKPNHRIFPFANLEYCVRVKLLDAIVFHTTCKHLYQRPVKGTCRLQWATMEHLKTSKVCLVNVDCKQLLEGGCTDLHCGSQLASETIRFFCNLVARAVIHCDEVD